MGEETFFLVSWPLKPPRNPGISPQAPRMAGRWETEFSVWLWTCPLVCLSSMLTFSFHYNSFWNCPKFSFQTLQKAPSVWYASLRGLKNYNILGTERSAKPDEARMVAYGQVWVMGCRDLDTSGRIAEERARVPEALPTLEVRQMSLRRRRGPENIWFRCVCICLQCFIQMRSYIWGMCSSAIYFLSEMCALGISHVRINLPHVF